MQFLLVSTPSEDEGPFLGRCQASLHQALVIVHEYSHADQGVLGFNTCLDLLDEPIVGQPDLSPVLQEIDDYSGDDDDSPKNQEHSIAGLVGDGARPRDSHRNTPLWLEGGISCRAAYPRPKRAFRR